MYTLGQAAAWNIVMVTGAGGREATESERALVASCGSAFLDKAKQHKYNHGLNTPLRGR